MKPELLLARRIYEPALAELERDFVVHQPWNSPDPEAYVRQSCANVRAAVTRTTTGFSRRDFEALPRLEMLALFGPYYTLVDLAAAKERGVAVSYTPDSTAEPVADLAMGMIVAVMRRLCEADRFVRAGRWRTEEFASGTEVRGKTCGIVGLGRIGREIAQRAASFGMSICYHGPRIKDGVAYPYFADLEAMARKADVLVVACGLTPETTNLVNARTLRALGPGGFLVNISRGKCVDEEALVAALRNKEIAGAALDVFRDEPGVPAPLLQMDNVVLSPHMGTSTRECRDERTRKLLANLRAYFAGQPLPNAVGA
jgi:lactate dehydrogenase-like 2-hydroxyacid dehydrogenase